MDSDKWTDTELERLEKRIAEQYEQAQKELGEKAQEYFLQFEDRFKREELAMLTTSLTKDEVETKWVDLYGSNAGFERWYKGADHAYGQTKTEAENKFKLWEMAQLGRGQHWYDMRDQMAERLSLTNLIASGYINNKLPDIYIANSNGMAEIARESAMSQGVMGVRFDLVDEYVVRNLMMESSPVRPYKPVNISLDESNSWSKNKLQNALLQGVLQGDSITHIADRFQAVTNMNRTAAIRNARTATTYAQNKAKQDRLMDLKKQGCSVTKKWKATADERTRPEHWEAHLQEVDVDQPFEVGGELLMEPGDPSASGWNKYNCRCRMSKGKIKFKSILSDKDRERAGIRILGDYKSGSTKKAPSQEELEFEKAKEEYVSKCGRFGYSDLDKSLQKKIDNAIKDCKNPEVLRLWNKYKKTMAFGSTDCPYGAFIRPDGRVFFDANDENAPFDIMRIILHEMSHSIDGQANNNFSLYKSYAYKNGLFDKTLKSEFNAWVDNVMLQEQKKVDEHYDDLEWLYKNEIIKVEDIEYYFKNGGWNGRKLVYTKDMACGYIANSLKKLGGEDMITVSDAISGMTDGKTRISAYHDEEYWREDKTRLAGETFANLTSAELCNQKDAFYFSAFFPKSYRVYTEMISEM